MLAWVQDGRIVRVSGDPDHPVTRGAICGKAARYTERLYSPDRVLYPLKRVGKRGAGEWKRVTWDEVLDELGARIRKAMQEGRQKELTAALEDPAAYDAGGGAIALNRELMRIAEELGRVTAEWETATNEAGATV